MRKLTRLFVRNQTFAVLFETIALVVASACFADAANPTESTQTATTALGPKDKTFMMNISNRGVEEMAMAKLAGTQALNAAVKSFSAQIITERASIDKDLNVLASRRGVALPKENIAAEISHNPKLGPLAYGAGSVNPNLIGFDKRWALEMEKDLRSDLSDCAEEAKNGSDPEVKAWAAKAFELMRKQLLTVMDIRSKLK